MIHDNTQYLCRTCGPVTSADLVTSERSDESKTTHCSCGALAAYWRPVLELLPCGCSIRRDPSGLYQSIQCKPHGGAVDIGSHVNGWDVVIATRNGKPYTYRRIDGDMCRDGHPMQGTARWFSQNPRVLECGVVQ